MKSRAHAGLLVNDNAGLLVNDNRPPVLWLHLFSFLIGCVPCTLSIPFPL